MRSPRRQRRTADFRLRSHLEKLGFDEPAEYQRWCSVNGFSTDLHKGESDRESELLMSLSTGPVWDTIAPTSMKVSPRVRVIGGEDDILRQVLSGPPLKPPRRASEVPTTRKGNRPTEGTQVSTRRVCVPPTV